MIHRFLSQSKPVSFVLICLVLIFWILFSADYSSGFLALAGYLLVRLILLLAILFLLNFIIQKNKLTQANYYALYFFVLFWGLGIYIYSGLDILWALLFLLLSLRRILGLRTQTDLKQKVFDASFWLSLGMLFEPLVLSFFLLLFLGLLIFTGNPNRLWWIPVFGMFTVFFPVFTWYYWFENLDGFFQLFSWPTLVFWETKIDYKTLQIFSFIWFLSFFSGICFHRKMMRKSLVTRKSRELIFFAWSICSILGFLYYSTYPSVLLLALPFFSIPCASLTEKLPNHIWKDVLLYGSLLTVFAIIF